MAMQQIEVPSKAYLCRWVECAAGHTISWSVKPHKKSLNFGIFRHPGGNAPHPPGTAGSEGSATMVKDHRRPLNTRQRSEAIDCREKMAAAGLQEVYWHGRCEPEKVTTGTYQVEAGKGGMFALAFDNSFSKQISKTATVVMLTYPSNAPPPESHALHHAETSNGLHSVATRTQPPTAAALETEADSGDESGATHTGTGLTGVLKKRKRKRHQGYARRFFSLDFTSSTLSYYLNKDSSALRGAIPLSLAAISASKDHREICIDSGAEIWHLRANSDQEWEMWKKALERASRKAVKAGTTGEVGLTTTHTQERSNADNVDVVAEERGWAAVESLVGRISGIRDAVRRLTEEPQTQLPPLHADSEATSSATSVVSGESGGAKKSSFWKRKSSQPPLPPPSLRAGPNGERKSVSSIAASVPAATLAVPNAAPTGGRTKESVGENLQQLLGDLDSVVADFTKLVSENKQRRWLHRRISTHPMMNAIEPRASMESTASDEFFDAPEMDEDRVFMLNDNDSHDSSGESSRNQVTDDEASSDDDFDSPPERPESTTLPPSLAMNGIRDLTPLPLSPVQRRTTLPPATQLPPSLVGFLRKNVGKDLSTIAMPVSANEPLSLLQRSAEVLEYSELLDAALSAPVENGERLLYIAAFAISSFSNTRIKDRSIRKPFNPMLGETYELVREDKGFRYVCEKVSHRPVIMACHADSANWTFSQNPQPTQKFWGKSAELNTTGRVRIHFPKTGDNFSYTLATSFLRNILAGEKYVEPTGSMYIHHENTGDKATITFKPTKGMFGGRSEELTVTCSSRAGDEYPLSLAGKWTESLTLLPANREIWHVGPLVDGGAPQRYGFTRFAAQLNEVTAIERGKLPPTDSRLRPDQRLCEDGKLDEAEEVKVRLEERQRRRRAEMEEAGESWKPRWFEKVRSYADEEVWRVVEGEKGYWECRKHGGWEEGGVGKSVDVFDGCGLKA